MIKKNTFKPFKLTQAETSKDSNNIPSVKYQKKYYKVYFSKDVKKKHKNFDEGIMIVALSSLILMNSEGNKIYECNKPKFIDELIGNEEPFAVSHAYFSKIFNFFNYKYKVLIIKNYYYF